jgi:oligoribonuclease NrnB/cAMP/cGMP phosphodiesterase (DHH superfamily)
MRNLITIVYHVNARHDGCADGIGAAWSQARELFLGEPSGTSISEFYDRIDFIEGRISDLKSPDHLFNGKFKLATHDDQEGALRSWIIHYVDCCPAYEYADLLEQVELRIHKDAKAVVTITDHHGTNKPVLDRFVYDSKRVLMSSSIPDPRLRASSYFNYHVSAAYLCNARFVSVAKAAATMGADGPESAGLKRDLLSRKGLADFLSDYDTWEHKYPVSEVLSNYVKMYYDAWTVMPNRKYSTMFQDFDEIDAQLRRKEWAEAPREALSEMLVHLPPRVEASWYTFLQIRSTYVARKLSQAVVYDHAWTPYRLEAPVIKGKCAYVYADSYPNEIAAALLEDPEVLAVFVLMQQPHNTVKVSGRSNKKDADRHVFDVSSVAQVFGGGGHQSAAGFTIDMSRYTVVTEKPQRTSLPVLLIQNAVSDCGWDRRTTTDRQAVCLKIEDTL